MAVDTVDLLRLLYEEKVGHRNVSTSFTSRFKCPASVVETLWEEESFLRGRMGLRVRVGNGCQRVPAHKPWCVIK